MLLWLGFAVLSAVVLAFVLRPLWSASAGGADADAAAVFRDQLAEVAADLERGLIEPAEAAAARNEIARRLLATDAAQATHPSTPEAAAPMAAGPAATGTTATGTAAAGAESALTHVQRIAAALAVGVPVMAIAVYWSVGSPGLPDRPLAARLKAPLETADVGRLIATVEARLASHPEDGQGWDVIAPVYLRGGAFAKAAEAYGHAIRLLGETPRRLAGFAEATVRINRGTVTAPAREAWAKLARLEPERPEPRFWLAVAEEQAGRLAEAIAGYRALLASAPADASWRALVVERIAAAEARLGGGAGATAPRGPSEGDVAAAENLPPADRQRMIEGMVASLAERLAADGRDLAGWQRLIRAYAVLGRKEQALAALKSARGNFEREPASLAALADLARALGLET